MRAAERGLSKEQVFQHGLHLLDCSLILIDPVQHFNQGALRENGLHVNRMEMSRLMSPCTLSIESDWDSFNIALNIFGISGQSSQTLSGREIEISGGL